MTNPNVLPRSSALLETKHIENKIFRLGRTKPLERTLANSPYACRISMQIQQKKAPIEHHIFKTIAENIKVFSDSGLQIITDAPANQSSQTPDLTTTEPIPRQQRKKIKTRTAQ